MDYVIRHTKRAAIGVVGTIVLLGGIVLIPYPGPGWLVVFAGLAILATEFSFAQRLLAYARGRYEQVSDWLAVQPIWVKVLSLAGTTAVVLATLWLLNTFGLAARLLGLELPWVASPFF